MDKLPPSARALLDAAAAADDPSPAERARAEAVVRDALARQGIHDLPALDLALQASKAAGSTFVPSGLAVKLGIGAVLVVAAWVGVRSISPAGSSETPQWREPPAAVPGHPGASLPSEPVVSTTPPQVEASDIAKSAPAPHSPSPRANRKPVADDAALEHELKLLASADDLIRRGHFNDALRLLERAEPGGAPHALREERTALAILARCGRGPDDAVLRERDQFLRSSPRSVLAARVRQACPGGRVSK